MREAIRLSETDKAYFAGLVDALACIKIRRKRRADHVRRDLVMQFDGLTKSQVDWIRARFTHALIEGAGKKSPAFRVTFETRYAAAALTEALGYMIRMDAEARLVFKFASAVSKQGRRLTEDQERIRAEVDEQLGALKRGA